MVSFSRHRSILALCLATPLISASPIQDLAIRQENECGNIAAVFEPACWSQQNVDFYLADPATGWWATTPKCSDTHDDGINCCLDDELWSTCFIRLGTQVAGQDCSTVDPVTASKCTWDGKLPDSTPPEHRAQIRYTLQAIFTVQAFFTTYGIALESAFSNALSVVRPLTTTIDQVDVGFSPLNILTGLTVGLAFLGAPTLAATLLTLGTVVKFAAQTLSVSFQQAPGVAKTMWPQGTDSSVNWQAAALDQEISQVKKMMDKILSNGLYNIMSDLPTFVNFTQNGAFTTSESLLLPNDTKNGLDFALNTYMSGEALKQNGFYAVYVGTWSRSETAIAFPVQNGNCHPVTGGIICSETGDPAKRDESDGNYWSDSTERAYALRSHKKQWTWPILSPINANGWADLQALFDGSFNCTAEGKSGSTILNFKADDTLDMTCLSQLPIQYNPQAMRTLDCPLALPDGSCPFPVEEL